MHIELVIENLVLQRTLENFLIDLRHDVHSARSLSKLGVCHPSPSAGADAIITELLPDDTTSLDVLRAIQIRRPALPVVLVARTTWNILDTDIALDCGVHAYLRLPLFLRELELMLIRLVERMRQTHRWNTPRVLSISFGPPRPLYGADEHPLPIYLELDRRLSVARSRTKSAKQETKARRCRHNRRRP